MNLKALLHGTIRRMHSVRRYSSIPVIQPENVAEHSWQVAMIAMTIADDINSAAGHRIFDVESVLRKALVHDLSEVSSGDVIRSYKHSSADILEAMNIADEANMKKLANELDYGELSEWWSYSKRFDEGELVALADLLCVVSYCAAEERLGNSGMHDIRAGAMDVIREKFGSHRILSRYIPEEEA